MIKFIHNQKFCECQLISLWNSAIFLGLESLIPKQYSKKYKAICHRAKCIYGGVIDKDFEIKRLNLKSTTGSYNLRWIKKNLPVELSIFCHRGYHSILIVGIKNNNITLANYAKNRLHIIKWNKLLKKANRHVLPRKWELNA
jgi:hypothetical protein